MCYRSYLVTILNALVEASVTTTDTAAKIEIRRVCFFTMTSAEGSALSIIAHIASPKLASSIMIPISFGVSCLSSDFLDIINR